MNHPAPRKQGGIDPSFGIDGTYTFTVKGYDSVEPGGSERLRALARVHDGKLMLAAGVGLSTTVGWCYALARLTSDGSLDGSFGTEGAVVGSPAPGDSMSGAQAWPTPDRAIVTVLRSQLSRSWALTRHTVDGKLDTSFGTFGYVHLDAIRPAGEPYVVKGFIIAGPGHDFFFVGSTMARMDNGEERYAGGIVFRFDASGLLDSAFAGKGYTLVDVPLNPSGRITDALYQDDGKIVLSTATTAGNGQIVRLLPNGEPDPTFGTDGVFVVGGDSSARNEIEKLAWSRGAGLWGVGSDMARRPKVGILVALDDSGKIPATFNGGRLRDIDYGGDTGSENGFAEALHLRVEPSGGVTVVGCPYYNITTGTKRAIVGRHHSNGTLDVSFGEQGETGDRKGFYVIDLARVGFNFIFYGIDVTDDHVTLEIFNGDGGGGTNPDRTTVERYFATDG